MTISTTLTYVQNAEGEWELDTGQPDYNIKKQMMAAFGNVGLHMHKAEDIAWVTRVCELLYPHVTLQFAFLNLLSTLFDGVDEYVDMGDIAPFQFERTNTFSFSFWLKTTSSSTEVVVSKRGSSSGDPGYFVQVKSSGKIQVIIQNGVSNLIDVQGQTTVVNDGLWHNVVVTYDGSSTAAGTKIYVDNVLQTKQVNSDTLSASILNTRALKWGVKGTASSDFVGNLDEPAVWDKELSAADVGNIHNAGVPTDLSAHPAEPNLVSWWRAGDIDMFPTWTDNKGANDGTMTNMEAEDLVEDVP